MLITDEYRRLNAELHKTAGGYGSKGKAWAPRVHALALELEAATVLDYGCGKGSLKAALETLTLPWEWRVLEYDPAVPGKDAPPEPADLVVCTDVLEHVEPECIDDVIADLVRLANKAVLLAVACRAGKRQLADGRPDHLTVQAPAWWRYRTRKFGLFRDVECLRDLEYCAVLRK